jgi:hypothetical protein
MIQRIQSLWLLLASACAFASLKLPYYSGSKLNELTLTELNGTSNFLLLIATVAVGGLALVNIFLFKKRTLQLRLCVLGILLEAGVIFLYYREMQNFSVGTFSLTSILQMIIVLAFVLAAKGINKDAKLVKNSDRLR